MARLRGRAKGGFRNDGPAFRDLALQVRVLGRVGDVQSTRDGGDRFAGPKRAGMGSGVHPARHAGDDDEAGLGQLGSQ